MISQRVQAIELREGDTIFSEADGTLTLGRVSWEPLHNPGAPVTRVQACLKGETVPTLFWLPGQRVVRVQTPVPGP